MHSKKFHFFHFYQLLFLSLQVSIAKNTTTNVEFKVGVILDLDEVVGKVRLRCMSMALSDFYATHSSYKTRVVLHARNSQKDVIGAAFTALDLLNNMEVQAIIGIETSPQANLVADLISRFHVPLLTFSRTSPSLSSLLNPYFITMVQNDSSQVGAIVDILKYFRWTEVIFICEENDFGNQRISYLIDAFQDNEIRISYVSAIYSSSTKEQISEELHKLKRMQSKVFVVHATPSLGSRLFLNLQEMEMMSEEYAFIVTDSLTSVLRSMDSSIIRSMLGVLGVRAYISDSKELRDFKIKWKKELLGTTHLSIFELWAYDSVWALAMAVEKVRGFDHSFLKQKVIDNSSCLATHVVSKIGPNLVQAISNISLRGLSGEFHVINKQLQSSLFQIVNVIGRQGREIGIWSPEYGIMRDLNNVSNRYLGAIIWPGESIEIPKGCSFSTNGRTFKIAVPRVYGFDKLVKVTWDQDTQSMNFGGYCLDLFNTVMKKLPYKVHYEFIAYDVNDTISSNATGISAYDNMLYQVYLQKFDALVGDVTITANRSLYVEFTMCFTETGLAMIKPFKGNEKKDVWFFLRPLSKETWLAVTGAFITKGFALWILKFLADNGYGEGRVVGYFLWFVQFGWHFAAFIITTLYTAILTSMFTVQKLDGGDINQLMKSGSYVGYQSKVVKGLLNHLDFDDSKLKRLNSFDEFDVALSKGSKMGGVSAIIDEIPYLKLFLNKQCHKYYMVPNVHVTNGFGFVFQKGSPLVLEVSKALEKFKETQQMKSIELKWFTNVTDCVDPGSTDSLESLNVEWVGGLFLLMFVTLIFAILLFILSRHVQPIGQWFDKLVELLELARGCLNRCRLLALPKLRELVVMAQIFLTGQQTPIQPPA